MNSQIKTLILFFFIFVVKKVLSDGEVLTQEYCLEYQIFGSKMCKKCINNDTNSVYVPNIIDGYCYKCEKLTTGQDSFKLTVSGTTTTCTPGTCANTELLLVVRKWIVQVQVCF